MERAVLEWDTSLPLRCFPYQITCSTKLYCEIQVDRKLENVAVIIFTNGENECKQDSLHTDAIESIKTDGELFSKRLIVRKSMLQLSG